MNPRRLRKTQRQSQEIQVRGITKLHALIVERLDMLQMCVEENLSTSQIYLKGVAIPIKIMNMLRMTVDLSLNIVMVNLMVIVTHAISVDTQIQGMEI